MTIKPALLVVTGIVALVLLGGSGDKFYFPAGLERLACDHRRIQPVLFLQARPLEYMITQGNH